MNKPLLLLLLLPTTIIAGTYAYDTDLWHATSLGRWYQQTDNVKNSSGYYRFLTSIHGREDPEWILVVQWITLPPADYDKSKIISQTIISELHGSEFTIPQCASEKCNKFHINATDQFGYGDTHKYTLTFPRVGEYAIKKNTL